MILQVGQHAADFTIDLFLMNGNADKSVAQAIKIITIADQQPLLGKVVAYFFGGEPLWQLH